VFQLSPPTTTGGAWTFATLYSFTGGSDGGDPRGVILDVLGDLYSTTSETDVRGAFGTVFRLTQ
jgi:hypothetical protein